MIDDFPFVTAVIPNWNGKRYIVECLESLAALNYPSEKLEIIVYDNGSTDGSQEAIKQQFDTMRTRGFGSLVLVENAENVGAPAAYNQAIRRASSHARYIWKLDNDVTIEPDCLVRLIEIFQKYGDDAVGAVGGRFINAGRLEDEPMGARLMHIPKRWTSMVEYITPPPETSSGFEERLDMVSGACCLFPKWVFDEVEYFDERFFLYFDDTEFCLRLQKKGLHLIATGRAKVYHHGYTTTTSFPLCRLYYWLRNHLLLGSLYFEGWELAVFFFFQLVSLPWKMYKIIWVYARGMRWSAARVFAAAYCDFVRRRFGPCRLQQV